MKPSMRGYRFYDADLMMYSSNLAQTMTRDAVEFSAYAVDAAAITAFSTLGNQFENFPPDTFYLADVGIAAEEKNAAREQLLLETRKIANRALVKWGEDSSHYKKFGVIGITEMTDKSLLGTARLVIKSAEELLLDLATEGLTQIVIDDYTDVAQLFEDKLNALNKAIETRDIKSKERIALGNQVYALVSKYCLLGKTIWNKVDESKYNDYIIYNTPSTVTLAAPTNLTVDVATMVFSWDPVEGASEYQLEMAIGTEWEVIYTGADNFVNYVPPATGLRQYRTLAKSGSNVSPYSLLMVYNYQGLAAPDYVSASIVDPITGEVALNWGEVSEATEYKLYVSSVAVGAVAGQYVLVGQYAVATHTGIFALAQRHYFYVQAATIDKVSLPCDSVYVEL